MRRTRSCARLRPSVASRLPACLLAAFLLLAGAACQPGYGGQRVDFQIPGATAEASPQPTPHRDGVIRMAVAPVISPRETFTSHYQDLLAYLGDQLGMPVELVPGKTYAEINDMVRSGSVTLALVCTNPYLQGQQDFGMELLAAPVVNGSSTYYSYAVVRSGSPFQSFADLRGYTFAFSDPLSNSGRLAPLYALALMGETPESFFSRTIFTYAHDNSIKAVANGLVDGAAVDSLVYEYWARLDSEFVKRTRVIEKWGPFGINPLVVSPGIDPVLKEHLRSLLLNMDQDPEGRDILDSLFIDRFTVPDDGIYDSVRRMREFLASSGYEQ